MKKLPIAFTLLSAALLVAACSSSKKTETPVAPASNGEILVAEVDSFTGSQSFFGTFSRSGIQLAISQTNDAGGVGGRKIRLVTVDDQGKPEMTEAVVKKLIKEQKVVAVLGASASSRSLAMAPLLQKAGIPMITPASTNPEVTGAGDYIFRTCFIDTFQGSVMAKFVRENLKAKKVAILRDSDSKYSLGLAEFFKDRFVAMGGQIVADEAYKAGDVDFKRQLTAIRPKAPDVIYVPGYYTDVANIIPQARTMKISATFAGGDGWDSNELYKIGEGSTAPSYFTNHYAPGSTDPVHLKFATAYKAKFRTDSNADAALGYDAATVLFDAMKRAKSLSGPDLRDAIAQTKNFPGVTGVITLDANRDAIKSVVIFKVQGKKTEFIESIAP
ncbi:MAG: ABC transporter substrate-binding protein [Pseudomonadota bacterium]